MFLLVGWWCLFSSPSLSFLILWMRMKISLWWLPWWELDIVVVTNKQLFVLILFAAYNFPFFSPSLHDWQLSLQVCLPNIPYCPYSRMWAIVFGRIIGALCQDFLGGWRHLNWAATWRNWILMSLETLYKMQHVAQRTLLQSLDLNKVTV